MTFSDFIFKGTLITKTPNGDEENSDQSTRYLIVLTQTYLDVPVFELGLGE